jgi:hypothetical protein
VCTERAPTREAVAGRRDTVASVRGRLAASMRRVATALEAVADRAERTWRPWELPPLAQAYGLPTATFIVVPARNHVVYRTLGGSQGRIRDFQSNREKGRPRAEDEDFADHVGVSVFASEELAAENAVRYPKLIAAVILSEGKGLCLARTYADIEGHYTVWGDPDDLLASVANVSRHDAPD